MGYLSTNLIKSRHNRVLLFKWNQFTFIVSKQANWFLLIFITRVLCTKQNHHQDKCRNDTKAIKLHMPLYFIQITFGSGFMYLCWTVYHLNIQIPNPFKWSYGKKRLYTISKMRTPVWKTAAVSTNTGSRLCRCRSTG